MTHPAPNSELTGESIKLLKAGDVLWSKAHEQPVTVMYADAGGVTYHHDQYAPEGIFLSDLMVSDWLTFIGRPDADGWIHAPEGGWTENPVPGCRVEVKMREWGTTRGPSDSIDWSYDVPMNGDIIAFRLAAPSVERKPLTPIDYLVEALSPPKPDVAGARERERLLLDLTTARDSCQDGFARVSRSLIVRSSDEIQRQGEEIERLRDKVEGLDSDLRSAVEVAYQRGAHEWASLNYPQWVVWFQRNAAARARQGGPGHV